MSLHTCPKKNCLKQDSGLHSLSYLVLWVWGLGPQLPEQSLSRIASNLVKSTTRRQVPVGVEYLDSLQQEIRFSLKNHHHVAYEYEPFV